MDPSRRAALRIMTRPSPVVLHHIDTNEPGTDADKTDDAEHEDAQTQICDISNCMDVAQHHFFLGDAGLISFFSTCIRGVDMTLDFDDTTKERVAAMTRHLGKCLERKLLTLPKNAPSRDNSPST